MIRGRFGNDLVCMGNKRKVLGSCSRVQVKQDLQVIRKGKVALVNLPLFPCVTVATNAERLLNGKLEDKRRTGDTYLSNHDIKGKAINE